MFEDIDRREGRFLSYRLAVFSASIAVVFVILVFRLYYLQVVRGPVFRSLSENNRVSQVRVRAPRGNIYDRYGNLLVTNRPSFSVYLVIENIKDLPGTISMLGRVLEMDEREVEIRAQRVQFHRQFEPVRIKEDVSREVVAILESYKYEWPGVQIEVEPRRSYPFGRLATHLLGHVGQISQAELRKYKEEGYRTGDYIGKKGIEKVLDAELKGLSGILQVEVDSLGREIQVLASREPRPGSDVTLSLDLGLQQVVDDVLNDKVGAVVVMDPGTGEILAASSSPTVDPNRFIRGLSQEEWASVEGDERHPLQNRIMQAQYPPGSVFKIVTAIAALEKGVIDEKTKFTCTGAITYGKRQYHCWKKWGHGEVDLQRALVESCDVYFYQVGIRTGIDAIGQYARELGLGEVTGLSLGSEAGGLVPSRAWKKRVHGEPWFPGETLSVAIGQGYNLVTPLQMAVLASTMANNGTLYRPTLIRSITVSDGREKKEVSGPGGRQLKISPRTIQLVKRALLGVVNSQHGTGRAAAVKGLEVAGKTGTAQVVGLQKTRREDGADEAIPLRFLDHAWFVSYAPAGEGKVAIAVVVEHGGHGGSASAPLAGKILREMKNLGFFQLLAMRQN